MKEQLTVSDPAAMWTEIVWIYPGDFNNKEVTGLWKEKFWIESSLGRNFQPILDAPRKFDLKKKNARRKEEIPSLRTERFYLNTFAVSSSRNQLQLT